MTAARARLAYSSLRADEHARWVRATGDACLELAERHVELHGLIPGGSAQGEDGGGSRAPSASRPPLRLDVVDLVAAIDRVVLRRVALCRGALRLGIGKQGPTTRGLWWLARAVGPVYDADPETARETARVVWRMHRAAGEILGINPRAFRIAEPCPDCGQMTLWADPGTWRVACGAVGCAFKVPVNSPILRWST
jgi:hypothetical protein